MTKITNESENFTTKSREIKKESKTVPYLTVGQLIG